jgi:prepilin-type N-terminal cleavage/methylation domain-containing protein
MRISALRQRKSPIEPGFQAGFTLLELLVVMLLTGMIAGLAAPRFYEAFQRRQRESDFRLTEQRVVLLRHRLLAQATEFELDAESVAKTLPDGYVALELPEGFRLDVPKPIRFSANGACSGGSLSIVSADRERRELNFTAPFCTVSRAGN